MPQISDGAIASAAMGAGLSGGAVAIAVAVALAESAGNTTDHFVTGMESSYGLWQINMIGQIGVDRRRQFNLTSNEQLYDPATNARVMAGLSKGGTNWKPWTTFTRGTYLFYLSRGEAVATGQPQQSSGITTIPASLNDSFSSLTDFFNLIQQPQFWMRIGVTLAGAALVYFVAFKTVSGTKAFGETAGAVKSIGKKAIEVAAL